MKEKEKKNTQAYKLTWESNTKLSKNRETKPTLSPLTNRTKKKKRQKKIEKENASERTNIPLKIFSSDQNQRFFLREREREKQRGKQKLKPKGRRVETTTLTFSSNNISNAIASKRTELEGFYYLWFRPFNFSLFALFTLIPILSPFVFVLCVIFIYLIIVIKYSHYY